MARAQNPNSANSLFFICFNDCSFLDGQYTVWAQVIEGMELVDNITRGEPPHFSLLADLPERASRDAGPGRVPLPTQVGELGLACGLMQGVPPGPRRVPTTDNRVHD